MSTVYSTRFVAVQGLQGGWAFTVPVGFIAIVRDMDAYWGGGVNAPSVRLLGSEGQTIVEFHVSGSVVTDPAGTLDSHSWQWRGRQVFAPGETIAVSSGGDNVDVTVSGYLLRAP